jgi:hypothetical protein
MTGLYALRYVYWGTEHVRYMTEDAKGFLGMLLHACFVLSLARRLVPDSELKLSVAPAARGLRRASEMTFSCATTHQLGHRFDEAGGVG